MVSAISVVCGTVALLFARLAFNRYCLYWIPGPFLASLSDVWRAYYQRRGLLRAKLEQLHRRHGPVVRYGVRAVSISDPAAVGVIYGSGTGFVIAPSYDVIVGISNGKEVQSLVTTRDEKKHIDLRKSVSKAFTSTEVLDYERFVDDSLNKLVAVFEKNQTLDLARWTLLHSVDFACHTIFSESLGHLEKGEDVGGTAAVVLERFIHWGRWSALPGLERLIYRNPISMRLTKTPAGLVTIATSKLKARTTADKTTNPPERDLLQKFLEARQKRPDLLDTTGVTSLLMSIISAASGTTSITLTATINYLLLNPSALSKLLQEISGLPSTDYGAKLSKLPYLNAAIREAMRLCPIPSYPLERTVPPGGVTIARNIYLPAGTSAGCLPSAVHQDESVFGPDPQSYNPDRWLDEDEEKVKAMERAFVGFGKGRRLCLGQHLALMSLKKTLVRLLNEFELRLVDPEAGLSLDAEPTVVSVNPLWVKVEKRRRRKGGPGG